MRKTMLSGLLLGTASLLLTLGSAHADVKVTINNTDGATLVSAPPLPAGAPGVDQVLSGTAAFDSAGGGVQVQFAQPDGQGGELTPYTAQADLACDQAGTSCTWSSRVPFFFTPGQYTIHVVAAEPNPVGEPITAIASIHVTIL